MRQKDFFKEPVNGFGFEFFHDLTKDGKLALTKNTFPQAFFPVVAIFAEDCNFNLNKIQSCNGKLMIEGRYKGVENKLYMRYPYRDNIAFVVANINFIHQRQGNMTQLYTVLKKICRTYSLGGIKIESALSEEMINWCHKNGFVLPPGGEYDYYEKKLIENSEIHYY
jgi:hypothetical protein